jgi:hypothetical protein
VYVVRTIWYIGTYMALPYGTCFPAICDLLRSRHFHHQESRSRRVPEITTHDRLVLTFTSDLELQTALNAVAYFYMVAAWGGYVFADACCPSRPFCLSLLLLQPARRIHTVLRPGNLGTALAMQVPVVGWTPLKSCEQLGPMAVFIGLQLVQYCESIGRLDNYPQPRPRC